MLQRTVDSLVFGASLRDRMAAHLRGFERTSLTDPDLKKAAVAVAILPDDTGEACFVLTRRALHLPSHRGQWALPGGKLDAGEEERAAALRELREEVGVSLGEEAVLGQLDDYPTRSGFAISPVVVWGTGPAVITANPEEVAAAYLVPLRDLQHPDVPLLRSIPESDRPMLSVPLLGTLVHSPTASILYQLREVCLYGRATRVAHYEQPVFAWQ